MADDPQRLGVAAGAGEQQAAFDSGEHQRGEARCFAGRHAPGGDRIGEDRQPAGEGAGAGAGAGREGSRRD